jgi:hypothetical protein
LVTDHNVQVGQGHFIRSNQIKELLFNTDAISLPFLFSLVVFMNHSCNPTVSLDTDTMTVVAVVDLKEGKCSNYYFRLPFTRMTSFLFWFVG